mmetsp:Transcript_829/g.1014  ORF Transcript_829/g.1014 Transcript_829/m.1014 type:complete len:175 (-) Transcript_829:155-679(-)
MEEATRKEKILNGELPTCRVGSRSHRSRQDSEDIIKPYKVIKWRSEKDVLSRKSKRAHRNSYSSSRMSREFDSLRPRTMDQIIFEEGESVNSFLKKFEKLNMVSDEKYTIDELKRENSGLEKRRASYSQRSNTSKKKKPRRKSSIRKITRENTDHNFSYKPGFFSKKLLFLNRF